MESSLLNEKKYYSLSEPQKRIFISENLFKGTSIGNLCASYYLGESGDKNRALYYWAKNYSEQLVYGDNYLIEEIETLKNSNQ